MTALVPLGNQLIAAATASSTIIMILVPSPKQAVVTATSSTTATVPFEKYLDFPLYPTYDIWDMEVPYPIWYMEVPVITEPSCC